MTKKIPKLIQDDMWLQPFADIIINRIEAARKKEKELTGDKNIYEFASGYLYFGLHKIPDGCNARVGSQCHPHFFSGFV